MKKKVISLRGLSEILSEKEMKNVMGGSGWFDGEGNGTAGNCCYEGTALQVNGQMVYYKNCGVTRDYCTFLVSQFLWKDFWCDC